MKKIALFVCLLLPTICYSGALTLGPGVGVERINDKFNVDLDMVKGLYRFDSGLTIGGVTMFGYVDFLDIPNEVRYEAIIGYTTVLPKLKLAPYIFVSKGLRSYYSSKKRVDYYTATVGTKYNFTDNVYFDVSYRHRNTNDINWESNLYSIGFGYNISQSLSIQISFGKTLGDYRSEQAFIALLSRF